MNIDNEKLRDTPVVRQWEAIPSGGLQSTYRLAVPGGWLIKVVDQSYLDINKGFDSVSGNELVNDNYSFSIPSITFFPDPNHEWDDWAEAMDEFIPKRNKLDNTLLGIDPNTEACDGST